MPLIQSGATSDLLTVDPTSKAARNTPYDTAGNPVNKQDRASITPGAVVGPLNMGIDYKTARAARVSHSGSLRMDDDQLLLFDSCEGSAYDSNKWVQTVGTFTVTQTAAAGMLLNANNTVSSGAGAMHLSHRTFPIPARSGLVFTAKARLGAHFANNLVELGFGTPATVTTVSIANGACWRKDGSGQYVPVITINTGADILGTPIPNATILAAIPATDYANFEVQVFDDHAHFAIYTQSGVLVNAQDLDFSGTATPHFSVTHLTAMMRCYNAGTVSTAVQCWVQRVAIYAIDSINGRSFREMMSGMGYNCLTSPTAYTQLANYANSAAPASATLSNTAAGYGNMDGQFQFVPVTGAETDYALFALQLPAAFTFMLTGIRISSWIATALGATPSVLQWAVGLNSSGVSLATAAPYSPMKKAIGTQVFAASAAQGTVAADVVWTPGTPLACNPNRYIHIILKTPVGTTTGLIRGTVTVDGWFE